MIEWSIDAGRKPALQSSPFVKRFGTKARGDGAVSSASRDRDQRAARASADGRNLGSDRPASQRWTSYSQRATSSRASTCYEIFVGPALNLPQRLFSERLQMGTARRHPPDMDVRMIPASTRMVPLER
jgi:hypothetical protein